MKSIYNEDGTHTADSERFGRLIERVIKPVFKEYIKNGFNYRELAHEAQNAIISLEMEHALDVLYKKAKDRAKERKTRKELAEVLKQEEPHDLVWP